MSEQILFIQGGGEGTHDDWDDKLVDSLTRELGDDFEILDHAPLAMRVAWVRDLFERIDVDSRDEKAGAIWRAATDEGVNRSDSVYEWLRRAGAGRVLNPQGTAASEIPLPYPGRSREWLAAALVECARCHEVVERRSPVQRHCRECRASLKGSRSRAAVARAKRPGHPTRPAT